MTQFDAIRSRAKADLIIPIERGLPDLFLWEQSVRLAHTAQRIAHLPTVMQESPDEMALVSAALYLDSAWVLRVRAKEVSRLEVLVRSTTGDHRESSAAFMEKSLSPILPPETLARATAALLTADHRELGSLEARIIGDAVNLESFGIPSLWTTIRRGALEGLAVQAAIDRWHRRTEYHFWTARLNDSFHFPPVRAIAKKRLEKLERLMRELEEQHLGEDIVEQ